MDNPNEQIKQEARHILDDWLNSRTRNKKISRNTIAVGIVILDHLRGQCPATREDMISEGGEIKGSRAGLGNILEKYNVPRSYLKEATTRQVHQDGQILLNMLEWGNKLCALPDQEKENLLLELIGVLTEHAFEWLKRQNLKLDIDRRQAPTSWIHTIVENAKSRSGGVVEQHLIGAKLERRYKNVVVPNYPAHAADVQTARDGDFTISKIVYHVTATPGRSVVQKCAANIQSGKHPILLVPSEQEYRAIALAQDEGIDKEISIVSIESFLALNIIELATDENKDFFAILQEIVQIYNRRLVEVETDLSLQIEVD